MIFYFFHESCYEYSAFGVHLNSIRSFIMSPPPTYTHIHTQPGDWVDTFWDSYRTAYSLPNIFSLQLCPPLDVPILPKESSTVPQDGWMVGHSAPRMVYVGLSAPHMGVQYNSPHIWWGQGGSHVVGLVAPVSPLRYLGYILHPIVTRSLFCRHAS